MNDNGLLIEGAGAVRPADCAAANGVLRVAMATARKRDGDREVSGGLMA